MIGVSQATVRNWVKAGYLTPTAERPLQFREDEASELKLKLHSGSLKRLQSRVNKSHSEVKRTPIEYSSQASSIEMVERISAVVSAGGLSVSGTLYVVAVRLLVLRGEMIRRPELGLENPLVMHSFRRTTVRREVCAWPSTDLMQHQLPIYESIYSSMREDVEADFLGLLYQSLSKEGSRNSRGAYYTPAPVVEDALRSNCFDGQRFLDPCCGTGSFLLAAARILHLDPSQLWGVDNDQLAVRIARLNVLLAYRDHDSELNIWCQDALEDLANGQMFCSSNHLRGSIDYIATNPPWGIVRSSAYSGLAIGSSTNEAFSLFLYKSLALLREGGTLSFILPDAFLGIKAHSSIRNFILCNARVLRIVRLGRVFTGVLSGVIRLDLIKGTPSPDWNLSVCVPGGGPIRIPQARFLANPDLRFDVDLGEAEDRVIRKLYAVEHTLLKRRAEWALGVVTGDNKRFLSPIQHAGMEPIFKGGDVGKYTLRAPHSYVHYDPLQFQQVAGNDLYRAPEKLVYRFISSRLVFAYDNKQRLTLNSANVLVPSIPGLSVKVVLAFLNSAVFQFIFHKKFSTNKVLRGDIEKLPFPSTALRVSAEIEILVDSICAGEKREDEIDELVFKCFSLSDQDACIIRQSLRGENGTA